MYNCLITGSGRSGTSLMAGTLSKEYYRGRNLIPPRKANPKGFFESGVVNRINEAILQEKMPKMQHGQRWLGVLGLKATRKFKTSDKIIDEIKAHTSRYPYCYKDPRFCYTLPVWRPHLKNVRFICVFRHPSSTIRSVMREQKDAKYLHNLNMPAQRVQVMWRVMYQHVLGKHRNFGDWMFIHYDQMFNDVVLNRVGSFLDTEINMGFPEMRLKKRIPGGIKVEGSTQKIYDKLCDLAGYKK